MSLDIDIQGVELIHVPLQKTLIQNWTGFITSSNFRLAIDTTVSFFEKNDVVFLISDTLKQSVVSPKDISYAASKMPDLFQFGMMRMAFVLPEKALTAMSVKRFSKETETSNIAYFESRQSALNWVDNLASSVR